jgi:hypothetical protein
VQKFERNFGILTAAAAGAFRRKIEGRVNYDLLMCGTSSILEKTKYYIKI